MSGPGDWAFAGGGRVKPSPPVAGVQLAREDRALAEPA